MFHLFGLTRRLHHALWREAAFSYPLFGILIAFLPILTACIQGVFFGNCLYHMNQQMPAFFKNNVLFARKMEPLNVGLAPYHVPQILDPTDWWTKLGLVRPLDFETYPDLGIPNAGELASLEVLYRRTDTVSPGKPWHHWVHASNNTSQFEDGFLDEWDRAFDQLLQHRYAFLSVESADFHYITCPSNFLCAQWMIEGPALLHFTTAPEEHSGRPNVPGVEPVAVRVINLPLQTPAELGLPGTFPSYLNQMRAVTSNTSLWATYPAYSFQDQGLDRLERCRESAERSYPWTYGTLVQLEQWVNTVFGTKFVPLRRLRYLSKMGGMMASFKIRVRLSGLVESMRWEPDEAMNDKRASEDDEVPAPEKGGPEDDIVSLIMKLSELSEEDVQQGVGQCRDAGQAALAELQGESARGCKNERGCETKQLSDKLKDLIETYQKELREVRGQL